MGEQNPLASLPHYSHFLAELVDRPTVLQSTLAVWSASPYTGIAEGEIFFPGDFKLRILEELDFAALLITAYSYELYRASDKLYWYDDFPHPDDPELAAIHPHHKHVPPDIKHHRVLAPELSYTKPNIPFLIQEIEQLLEE
jgi:hypothetical protein